MSILFAIMLAGATPNPADILGPNSPAYQPDKDFEKCLNEASAKLYNSLDSAETIASGAMSACGPQRLVLSQAMLTYFESHQDAYEKPVLDEIDALMVSEGQELARLFVLMIRSKAQNAPNK